MGEVIGVMLAFYLIGKVLEWAILKRVIARYETMVSASSFSVLTFFSAAWILQRNQEYARGPAMLISMIVAAILLPFIRVLWRNRKNKKAGIV